METFVLKMYLNDVLVLFGISMQCTIVSNVIYIRFLFLSLVICREFHNSTAICFILIAFVEQLISLLSVIFFHLLVSQSFGDLGIHFMRILSSTLRDIKFKIISFTSNNMFKKNHSHVCDSLINDLNQWQRASYCVMFGEDRFPNGSKNVNKHMITHP